jgi:hypothetical protein
MRPHAYPIDSFRWVKHANTFYTTKDKLFTHYKNELVSFELLTGKKQFYIENPRTKNRRRFTFKHEYFDLKGNLIYVFGHTNEREQFEVEIKL